MGRPGTKRSTLLSAAAVLVTAGGLCIAPPRLQQIIRGAVLDAVVSGQALAMNRYEAMRESTRLCAIPSRPDSPEAKKDTPNDSSRNLERICRQLRFENA